MSRQLYPALDAATEAALRASIERFGVLVPPVVDQHGEIIDGHHRSRKLAKYPGGPLGLIGQAKARREYEGGTVGRNIAGIAVGLYNKGRRTGQVEPL